MFDINQEKGKFINARVLHIDSKIDLFKNRAKVYDAIRRWTNWHPLLRCRILKQKEIIDGHVITKRYFAYALKEMLESLENVIFLTYTGAEEGSNSDYWQLLLENELTMPLDATNGPLWRLKFLEINEATDALLFNYCVYFTAHHAILDGSNAYEIMKELFKIIEYEVANMPLLIDSKRQNLIELEISYPNDPRFSNSSKITKLNVPTEPIIDIIIPDYMKPVDVTDRTDDTRASDGLFLINPSSVPYTTINEILKKRVSHLTRFKVLSIESDTFQKVLKKCKLNRGKFTGCLEVIIALAFQNTYKYFSKSEKLDFELKYNLTVNQRPHLEPRLDTTCMGAWINGYISQLADTYDLNDKLFWKSKFWEVALAKSKELHNFLKEKSFFKREVIEAIESSIYSFEIGFTVKDVNNHYSITNIGAVASCAQNSLNNIFIRKHHSIQSYTSDEYRRPAYHSVTSIGDNIFWTSVYNCNLVSESVISYWNKCILEIFDLVAND